MNARTGLLLILPVLGLLLLGAHLLHAGFGALAAVAVALIGLLAVRRAWAARTVQVVLAMAVVEWLLTAAALAQVRVAHDQPYARLLVILGAVAACTALGAVVFQHRLLRARFGLGRPSPTATGSAPGQ